MVERVIATETAQALIARLQARHGEQLMFFQSGGCCDGSAPMCYLVGELTTGPHDRLLGHIGGCPFYISASQYAYWQHTQLVIDVTAGHGDNFSLEGSEGVSFITRSRLFTEAEWEALAPLD
ncbi:MAG: DUF779 domain-containing protein [Rhodoferax sp.]